MVKLRGIEICIISQFDICKLPEFQYHKPSSGPKDPFQLNYQHENAPSSPFPSVACFVPIYPGSQIWFEYTVDGPHPPEAAWFFKLLINGKVVTSWDCTAKHGFHGKMMYNLVSEGLDPDSGRAVLKTQALRFGDGLEDGERGSEFETLNQAWERLAVSLTVCRLTNSGYLEPCIRPRRYKYQLLDPVDMPYAAFQFHFRPYEYFEEHGIVQLQVCPSTCSTRSSIISESSGNVQLVMNESAHDTAHEHWDDSSPLGSSPRQSSTLTSPTKIGHITSITERPTLTKTKSSASSINIPLSDSDDSLSVRTKDSIEDLSSRVPRSPRSPRSPSRREKNTEDERTKRNAEIPPSPTPSTKSPRQRLKKKLTVTINGANFDVDRKRRPLSPFNSGGMLRKACVPQTAPATVTEFGPTVEEEVKPKLQKSWPETETKMTLIPTCFTTYTFYLRKLMSSYRRRSGHNGPQQPYRPYHASQQDDFYDDRSRSRSRERRQSSPQKRSPPHADHQSDRLRENSIFVVGHGVQIEDVTAAMTGATGIMMMIAARPLLAEADLRIMTETTLAPIHETTAVEVEADIGPPQTRDHRVEALRAGKL
ncbi:hypothetical protein AYO21_11531 [Fonsecaea monophora]|uniref:Uncharacterized protein n=1 Tax=Fonsecaea monophora TaxID=254056 RepID=A0A177ES82_9EURO|nr:hypothetical protein AYO21_11531 [Fonsecaea monophora]OAG34321.1 hypothetical protein AYO21_11531 [Fonsecaea monophora]